MEKTDEYFLTHSEQQKQYLGMDEVSLKRPQVLPLLWLVRIVFVSVAGLFIVGVAGQIDSIAGLLGCTL